jgi:hypothetical protein
MPKYTKRPQKRYIVAWTREQTVDGREIPDHWIICNAPRPLYGDEQWQGPFIKGIFYAAINPDDLPDEDALDTAFMLHRNAELDAAELVFVTQERCIEVAMDYYRENFADTVGEIDPANPGMREHLVRRGLDLLNDSA